MKRRFGGEYELVADENRTSTITARILFWELVLIKCPQVAFDLLGFISSETELQKPNKFQKNTPLSSYFEFVFKSSRLLNSSLKGSERKSKEFNLQPSEREIRKSALKNLTPKWELLQENSEAKSLCLLLEQWAQKWNLTDDWCLNFALDVLRDFTLGVFDSLKFTTQSIQNVEEIFCSSTLRQYETVNAWNKVLESYLSDIPLQSSKDFYRMIEKYPVFKFSWEEIEVNEKWEPLFYSKEKFIQQVELELWIKFLNKYVNNPQLLVGMMPNLKDLLESFQNQLDDYVQRIETIHKRKAKKTPQKDKGDAHFHWLIDFQILHKEVSKIVEEDNQDRKYKTIKQGLERTAEMISLTLRPAQSKRVGRTKGLKEKSSARQLRVSK